MEVLLNELSLHGQFSSVQDFESAIDVIMQAREKLHKFGGVLRCHRNLKHMQVTCELNLQEAVAKIDRNKRTAFMLWIGKEGPFWEDGRQHTEDDYFEFEGNVITDTGIGEAAYRCFHGSDCQIFSFESLNWKINPIIVDWHRDNNVLSISVTNHWDIGSLEIALDGAERSIKSWQQLANDMPTCCLNLTFSQDCFNPLYPHPFVAGAANRIVELLKVLDKFKTCFNAQGNRTQDGQHLYQDHFTGAKAWFSDSSDSEKNDFKSEMTFSHPENKNDGLFCPWHGKVKTPQFRIHFSWPISAKDSLYVPYVGPKITKR